MDQSQELGLEELSGQDGGQGAASDEDSGDVELLAQLGQISLAEELGDEDRGPHAGPGDDVDIQIHHALRHPQGGKGVLSQVVGDHQGVDDVIQLLEDVRPQQGQSEPQELGSDGPGGELELARHRIASCGKGKGRFPDVSTLLYTRSGGCK